MYPQPAVRLSGVSKRYPIVNTPLDLLPRRQRNASKSTVALEDVSLELRPNEVLGLIGANGAGKSTLLRVMAGITPVSRGTVERNGTIYPLLDLKAGLNPLLSGRGNVRNRLAMRGLSRSRIDEEFDRIVEFAELEHAIDRPMRTYSAGMRVRLAFAISIAAPPDILLLDELLAVGDEFFADKSFERVRQLASEGRATVLASHDWTQTFRLCDRVIWLDQGRVRAEGAAEKLLYEYLTFLNAFEFDHRVVIESLEVLGPSGPSRTLRAGEPVTVRFSYRCHDPRGAPFVLSCGWMHAKTGESVLSSFSGDHGFVVDALGEGEVEIHYPELPLAAGEYDYALSIFDPEQGAFPVTQYDAWAPLTGRDTRHRVEGRPGSAGGIIDFPARWSVREMAA